MNVLIAEDHQVTAKLLSKVLTNNTMIEIAGIARNGAEAVQIAENVKIDVILMDINMPVLDGISAMLRILKNNQKIKFVILSNYTEPWIVKQSLNAGASGYITKRSRYDVIVNAINEVFKGGVYLDELLMDSIIDDYATLN